MWVVPAQRAAGLGVVLVVVQTQQQLRQVRVDLMVSHAGEDFEEQGRLAPEALKRHHVSTESDPRPAPGGRGLPSPAGPAAESLRGRPAAPRSAPPESRSSDTTPGSHSDSGKPAGQHTGGQTPTGRPLTFFKSNKLVSINSAMFVQQNCFSCDAVALKILMKV